ncbi:hypothetical protein [Chlamydiifrater phoenicopteri]|uniref:hypothetical protein n=1 Tax=Chlamydiifrater phoenicopteri TaxID=2681469 RepID=UPI001BCF34D7|nr:hypothetical protein [Chlamydiifrater phoenicopteri]
MSSWLSQSCEINLTQRNYPSATEPGVETKPNSYSISQQSNETVASSSRTLFNVFEQKVTKQIIRERAETTTNLKELAIKVCSKKEAILFFGFSEKSQSLPREIHSQSTLWKLFSQPSRKESEKLFQDLHSHTSKAEHESPENQSSCNLEKNLGLNRSQKALETDSPSLLQKHSSFEKGSRNLPETPIRKTLNPEKNPLSQKENLFSKESRVNKNPWLSLGQNLDKDNHQEQQEKHQEEKEHSSNIKRKSATIKKTSERAAFFKHKNHKNKKPLAPEVVVPVIPLPSVGVFTLSYLLTKQGILCDYASYGTYKDNIEATQKELELTHKQRMKELKNNLDKENTAKRWGTLATLVEWIMPWLSIGLSVLSISSGESIFATLTLFSGLITLTLALMDSMDAWEKLERLLPGSNQEKKRKITRMAYFSILTANSILSLITVKYHKLEMSSMVNGLMLGVAPAFESASAVIRSGAVWTRSMVIAAKGSLVSLENLIDQLNQERDDTYQSVEELVENIQEQFEAISRILSLEQELNASHLSLMRS